MVAQTKPIQGFQQVHACVPAAFKNAIAQVLTGRDICSSVFEFLKPSPLAICNLVCRAWSNGNAVVKAKYFATSLSLLRLFRESKCGPYFWLDARRTCKLVAQNGDLASLKYWHKNDLHWDRNACDGAAEYGHLDCLKYLHENGCPWESNTTSTAARCGQLDCLKYLHENDCPWDRNACDAAAWSNLDCLRYIRKNGGGWSVWATYNAAISGHLDCLKFLRKNGCPCDWYTIRWAWQYHHLACLRYLHKSGIWWDGCKGCTKATLEGHSVSAS